MSHPQDWARSKSEYKGFFCLYFCLRFKVRSLIYESPQFWSPLGLEMRSFENNVDTCCATGRSAKLHEALEEALKLKYTFLFMVQCWMHWTTCCFCQITRKCMLLWPFSDSRGKKKVSPGSPKIYAHKDLGSLPPTVFPKERLSRLFMSTWFENCG